MNMNISRQLMVVVATALLASGCASLTAPTYSPHYETIDRLKKIDLEKMSVGEVQPRDPNASVNKITLRGSTLASPSGTFASYLENAIRSDLMEMRLYDPTSSTRIDATILKNDIDVSGIGTGHGVMEVKLTINKKGALVFEKVYLADTQFESSFAGAVAIPRGQSEYPNLVRALLQNVYGDPAFIEAVKK
jgi:hypothetical protein